MTATFADTLRALRERQGMSRSDLASASGLSYPYVSQLETGLRKPSRKAAAELARALSVHPLDFEATIPADASDPEDVRRSSAESARVLAGGIAVGTITGAEALSNVHREVLAGRIADLVAEVPAGERIDLMAEVQRLVLHRLYEHRLHEEGTTDGD